MRQYQKRDILHIISLLKKVHKGIEDKILNVKYQEVMILLEQCQQSAIEMGEVLEKLEGVGTEVIIYLEEYCEQIYQLSLHIEQEDVFEQIDKTEQILGKAEACIRGMKNEKIKILFLPYKASMWTSFESIWQCAVNDEECSVSVVPIPYYEIGEALQEPVFRYEGNKFPAYVPVTLWKDYDLIKEHPDLVFIHNPYDDGNNLTSVDPFYYSENLKKNCEILIYSPYFTISGYTKGKSDFQYLNKGSINADKIIVQSEFVKRIYESYGYASEKLLAFGSPKMDAVIQKYDESRKMPKEWKKKLEGKKVFLLNTHLSYFPSGAGNKEYYGYNYAERYHEQLLKAILNRKDCGLIWRPHPLLFTMIETRFPECREYVMSFKKRLEESENCVIDTNNDYMLSFSCSDALISTYSSLINEYLVTGKPVMIFQTKPTDEGGERSPIDFRTCYFKFKKDGGMSFGEFISMVQKGEDPKRDERIKMLRNKAFASLDGTAGLKIFAYLKKWITENT